MILKIVYLLFRVVFIMILNSILVIVKIFAYLPKMGICIKRQKLMNVGKDYLNSIINACLLLKE